MVYLTHSVATNRGGMELIGRDLMVFLQESFEITIVSGDSRHQLPEGVRAVRVPLPRRPAVARIWLYRLLAPFLSFRARRQSQLVYSNGAVTTVRSDVTTVHLCHAAAQRGAHSPTLAARWARAAALRLERRQIGHGAGRLVAVSRAVRIQLEHEYQQPSLVINNGIDLHLSRVRRERGDGPLRCIIVTHDFLAKGVPLAIEALALTHQVTVTVVGSGDLNAARESAQRRGVAERITFLGPLPVDEIPYHEHDVVMSLSGYESFGLTMVEGAAQGCVVVATDTGVAGDFVEAGAGVFVTRDAPDLVRAWSIVGEKDAWHDMSQRARHVAQQFDRGAMRSAYLALFEQLVSR